jgi:hypothetical protein
VRIRNPILVKVLAAVAAGALPVVLLVSAWRTLGEMNEQREVYLRDRAARLAGRLETLPVGTTPEALVEALGEDERGGSVGGAGAVPDGAGGGACLPGVGTVS